jgi:hypothetical protein
MRKGRAQLMILICAAHFAYTMNAFGLVRLDLGPNDDELAGLLAAALVPSYGWLRGCHDRSGCDK